MNEEVDESERYTRAEMFGDSKIIIFLKKLIVLFRKDALNLTVNTLIMLQMIYISNKHCFSKLSIYQTIQQKLHYQFPKNIKQNIEFQH